MDKIQLFSQIDLSMLDREWSFASGKDTKFFQKRSRGHANYFRAVTIMGMLCGALIPIGCIAAMILDGKFEISGFLVAIGIALLCFIFLPARGKQLVENYSKQELMVVKKNVFCISKYRTKYGAVMHVGEWTEENELKVYSLPLDYLLHKESKRQFMPGDVLTLIKTSNNMFDIRRNENYQNVLVMDDEKKIPFQKLAERKLFEEDDHRKIEFYMKKTPSYIRFMAVRQRLDISDDAVMASLNRYFLEEYTVEEASNPKLFSDFMSRMVEEVEREMKASLPKEGNT